MAVTRTSCRVFPPRFLAMSPRSLEQGNIFPPSSFFYYCTPTSSRARLAFSRSHYTSPTWTHDARSRPVTRHMLYESGAYYTHSFTM